METIVVEAVSSKFKNKYNSGSVLAGGKWMQVSSKIDLNLFQKDSSIDVETKTNDKGYTSIVAVGGNTETAQKPKQKKERKEGTATTYEENKSRRILVQGIVQAVASSPALINLPSSSVEEAAETVKALSQHLIQFVDEETK